MDSISSQLIMYGFRVHGGQDSPIFSILDTNQKINQNPTQESYANLDFSECLGDTLSKSVEIFWKFQILPGF